MRKHLSVDERDMKLIGTMQKLKLGSACVKFDQMEILDGHRPVGNDAVYKELKNDIKTGIDRFSNGGQFPAVVQKLGVTFKDVTFVDDNGVSWLNQTEKVTILGGRKRMTAIKEAYADVKQHWFPCLLYSNGECCPV